MEQDCTYAHYGRFATMSPKRSNDGDASVSSSASRYPALRRSRSFSVSITRQSHENQNSSGSPGGSSHGQESLCSPRTPRTPVANGQDIASSPSLQYQQSKSLLGSERKGGVPRTPSWNQFFDSPLDPHPVTPDKKHMINLAELKFGLKFATGAYSRLYRGEYRIKEVAIKVVQQPKDDKQQSERLARQFTQEVSLLSRLHHKNIVEFVGALKKPPVFFVVMEYLPGGSLRALLHKNNQKGLALTQVLDFAMDIAEGMDYLHSQGILHLDLKSANLVLSESNHVKVTDFGVARTQAESASMTQDSGTFRWMAPEMIKNKTSSTKADVYGFGIILWELYTGQIPYEDMSTIQAAYAVAHKNTRPRVPDSCPRPLKQLMEECWAENPDKRPHFWQIVQRLGELQDCIRRNVSLRSWKFDFEKRNALKHMLQRCRLLCAQF